MIRIVFSIALMLSLACGNAQQLQLLDRFNGNKVVNDSTITVFSSDPNTYELTQYFTMKNNTDRPLAVYLKKTINSIADSTTDYYCFGVQCWPGNDSTDIADTIPAGGEDYTFAAHACHVRRFDYPRPLMPPGQTSITYTVYDQASFPQPVQETVTVIYHLSGLGVAESLSLKPKTYPNPALKWLTVKPCKKLRGHCDLFIYNIHGAMVLWTSGIVNEDRLTIDVEHFSPGLYFGKIVTSAGDSDSFTFQVVH